jgi:hypothetical protein
MPEFLLERYVPRNDVEAARAGAGRAQQAAEQVSTEGMPVRCLWSLFIPDEETCLHLYEARCAEDVRAAARRAAFGYGSVVEAISEPTQARA